MNGTETDAATCGALRALRSTVVFNCTVEPHQIELHRSGYSQAKELHGIPSNRANGDQPGFLQKSPPLPGLAAEMMARRADMMQMLMQPMMDRQSAQDRAPAR